MCMQIKETSWQRYCLSQPVRHPGRALGDWTGGPVNPRKQPPFVTLFMCLQQCALFIHQYIIHPSIHPPTHPSSIQPYTHPFFIHHPSIHLHPIFYECHDNKKKVGKCHLLICFVDLFQEQRSLIQEGQIYPHVSHARMRSSPVLL